jgi:hypothetical protein
MKMLKRLVLSGVIALGLSSVAWAQNAPANADECNNQGAEIAQKAEEKKLDDTKTAKVEELLGKLDEQCQGSKFTEAAATMKELSATIGN